MANSRKDLKAYVRFDGSGRVVPGSLILRRKMPKVGKWKEITAYECCNPTPTPAPTYPLSICIYRNYGMGILSGTLNFTTLEDGYPVYEGIVTQGASLVSYTIKYYTIPPPGTGYNPNSWALYDSSGPGLGISDNTATTSEINPTLATWGGTTVTEGACPS